MIYTLKIGNLVEFPVSLKIRNGGKLEEFKFFMTGKRLDSDEAKDLFTSGTEAGEQTVVDFLKANLTAWRGQTLVRDEEDKPAPFNSDALAAMFTVAGASGVIYASYLKEIIASDGTEGRRKNS